MLVRLIAKKVSMKNDFPGSTNDRKWAEFIIALCHYLRVLIHLKRTLYVIALS